MIEVARFGGPEVLVPVVAPGFGEVVIDVAVADTLTKALADRRFTPVIGQLFTMDQAAGAHRAIESRTAVGKTLLTVA